MGSSVSTPLQTGLDYPPVNGTAWMRRLCPDCSQTYLPALYLNTCASLQATTTCALLPGSASGKQALCACRRSIVCKGLAQHLALFRLRLVAEWRACRRRVMRVAMRRTGYPPAGLCMRRGNMCMLVGCLKVLAGCS